MNNYDGLCECGHPDTWHVPLPNHPDHVEECQADNCSCGQFRASRSGITEATNNARPDKRSFDSRLG